MAGIMNKMIKRFAFFISFSPFARSARNYHRING